jgi:hypothetical protein
LRIQRLRTSHEVLELYCLILPLTYSTGKLTAFPLCQALL